MATIPASTASQLPITYQHALANRYTPNRLVELAATDTKPLFFYGSLMFPSVIARVVGNEQFEYQLSSQMTPATLYGHERCAVRGADYPAVVPAIDNDSSTHVLKVEGMLVFDLTAEQRSAVHRYESGLYDLTSVGVEVEVVEISEADGIPVEKKTLANVAADVYSWGGRRDELYEVSEKQWSIEGFLSSDFAQGMVEVYSDND